ncbi:MAG: FAD-binding protein [candidate division Zixibacteria bacterium]|nr:FAD-binding protein [candidate division Zixibacteria bacterium]
MSKSSFSDLAASLKNRDSLFTSFENRLEYLKDATEMKGESDALVMAECEEDVVKVVRYAGRHKLSIVPRGAGTGLSGGCVPEQGSIVLSTERMTRLEIDISKKVAIVGPGVITGDLQQKAGEFGLAYPPDPASYLESTLGGNVAEGAGGLRCKRFGVTKDYVLGIRGVTAAAEILKTGCYNDNRGFALSDILIASEGTLLIITEISLRLIDKFETGDTFLVAFDSPKQAAQTVSNITASGIIPTILEFLDGDAAKCSNQYEKTEGLDNVAAILLIEIPHESDSKQADLIKAICEKNDCSFFRHESDVIKAEKLWKVRRNLSKAVKEIAVMRVSEDVVVPISRFPDLIEYVTELNSGSSLRINSFGHAGDGNLHVNFMADSDDPQTRELIEVELRKLLRKTIELGGTLTGEHGIGLAKRDYIGLEFDKSTLESMKWLKQIFDPKALLNPGKIFS